MYMDTVYGTMRLICRVIAKIFAFKRKRTRNLTKNLNAENHKDCIIDFKIEKTAGLKLYCADNLYLKVD